MFALNQLVSCIHKDIMFISIFGKSCPVGYSEGIYQIILYIISYHIELLFGY